MRFTVNRLASETGLDRRTLGGMLRDCPSDPRGYTLADLVSALLQRTKLAAARLAKLESEARLAKLEADEKDGLLIDIHIFNSSMAKPVVEMVRVIRSSKLSDSDQDLILAELSKLVGPTSPDGSAQAATPANL